MIKQFITSEEINKSAVLSKLSIADDEINKYSEQLSDNLDYVSKLENMIIGDVQPLVNIFDWTNDSKPDGPQPSITQNFALKNVLKTSAEFFQVPEIIKKNG